MAGGLKMTWREWSYVVEVGALIGLLVVDEHLGEVVAESHDVTGDVDRAEVGFNGTDFVQCPGVV